MTSLPADAITDLSRPLDVAVSPDGTRVAVQVLENTDGDPGQRTAVFVVPADGSRDPHRLTRASDAGTMKWSPDGSMLGVVTTRERDLELQVEGDDEDESGSEEDAGPNAQLWVYDLGRGGDARQVTDLPDGISDFDWGPEGERVVVAARDPTAEEAEQLRERRDGGPIETERLQHKFDGVGYLDGVTTRLFVVDVDTRESRRLDGAYGGGILHHGEGLQPAWYPDDERIAFVANHGETPQNSYVQDLHVVDATTGEVEQITDGEYTVGNPTWSPDGDRLAFHTSDPVNLYAPAEVCVADPDSGSYHAVAPDLDRDLAWFQHLSWLDDSHLLTAIGDEGWSRFVRLSADGGHERIYETQSREASLVQFDADGGTVAFVRQHPAEGIDAFAMDVAALDPGTDEAPAQRLTDLNPALVADYDHPEIERITFTGGDGDDVEGIAFLPPGFDPADPDGDRPLLLSIHGGPRRYDEPHFDFDTAFWTTRGYVVLKVNYHGSTSYGRAFCERLKDSWNDIEVRDLRAGTDELVDRGWVDPDRLFVTGFSYGGRATAYLLTETDRFAAAVAEHGSYDMRSTFGTADSHHWMEIEFGLPWENPAVYERVSSFTDVDDIDTPLMLTAGEHDWRCPSVQAEQMHVALQKCGVDSKLVVYPDTNHVHHYVAEPDRAIHRLEAMAAWFERFDPAVGKSTTGE